MKVNLLENIKSKFKEMDITITEIANTYVKAKLNEKHLVKGFECKGTIRVFSIQIEDKILFPSVFGFKVIDKKDLIITLSPIES